MAEIIPLMELHGGAHNNGERDGNDHDNGGSGNSNENG